MREQTPVDATAVPVVRPRAWLREPKVQRHPGRHLVRGVSCAEPTAEEREFAELDGDALVPLYEEQALRNDEREACARQLERLGMHELAHCLRNYRGNLGGSERPNVAHNRPPSGGPS